MSKVTNRPKRLYKYEAFSERSLQNLKAQVIFFGSPKNFNDPYDCALTPVITPPSDAEIELVRANLLNNHNSSEKITVLRSAHPEDLRKMLMHISEDALTLAREDFVHRGISCFSEVNDELLMWSHYGGKYKGFCLEFDTSHQPFEKTLMASPNSPTRGHPKFPQAALPDYDVSGWTAKRAAASLSL